jgi:hypothetical protein
VGVVVTQDVDDFMRAADKQAMREAIESNWFVTPEMHGAVGDGVANDRDALEASLQHACDTGKMFIAKAGATYYMTGPSILLNRVNKPALVCEFSGATIRQYQSRIRFGVNKVANSYKTTTLEADIFRDDPFIPVGNVDGVEKNDLIEIKTGLFAVGVEVIQVYLVNELPVFHPHWNNHYLKWGDPDVKWGRENNVYIEGSVYCDVTQDQRDEQNPNAVPSVRFFRLDKPLVIRNLNMKIEDPTILNSRAIEVSGCVNATFENCNFSGNCRNQTQTNYCGYVNAINCTYQDTGYCDRNTPSENLPWAPQGDSFGYGLITSATFRVQMIGCVGMRGWGMYDGSQGTMLAVIRNCVGLRNGYTIGGHQSAYRLVIDGCVLEGNEGLSVARYQYVAITNCQLRGIVNNGIRYGGNQELYIHNNYFDAMADVGNPNGSFIFQGTTVNPVIPAYVSANHPRIFSLKGNTFRGKRRITAGFNNRTDEGQLIITDNVLTEGAAMSFVRVDGNTLIANNLFGKYEWVGMDLYLQELGATVRILNNVQQVLPEVGSNSALIRLRNAETVQGDIRIIGNTCLGQAVVRFNNDNTKVKLMANNMNMFGGNHRLATGNNTNEIEMAINNIYDNQIVNTDGPVITKSIGNVDASA